jgi:cephalosporin-C deacetylase-like acetyl esterase
MRRSRSWLALLTGCVLLAGCHGGSSDATNGQDAGPDADHLEVGTPEATADLTKDPGPATDAAPDPGQPDEATPEATADLAEDPGPATDATPDPGQPDEATPDAGAPDEATPEATADLAEDPGAATDEGGDALCPEGTFTLGTSGCVPLFDQAAIRDASTAQCTFTNQRMALKDATLLDVWDVSYVSWEAVDGVLQPVTIRGFFARPSGTSTLPGVIHAHGLGGCTREEGATGPAALLGMAVLAYTGPGGGSGVEGCAVSEGLPAGSDNGYHLFDTLPDVRGTWFWGHPVAAMRGLTCLTTRPDVDASRLGMTGFSAGGVATLVVSGADDRVKAAVPLSACGRWDLAVQSPDAWQNDLLQAAGLSAASPEWATLLAWLDPAVVVAATKTPVLMVNGTSDEFFPLNAHVPTLNAITGATTRTSLAANFDHGCYALTGGESADTIAERADLRARGGQRMWLRHWLTSDASFAYVPAAPVVVVQAQGGGVLVTATVDGGGSALQVEEVRFWWSTDDAFLWGSNELDKGTGVFAGVWWALLPVPPAPNLVTYVDVQYKTKALLAPDRFSISSVPALPAGFVPHLRAQDSCL